MLNKTTHNKFITWFSVSVLILMLLTSCPNPANESPSADTPSDDDTTSAITVTTLAYTGGYPWGITSDGTSLFIGDQYNYSIRTLNLASGAETVLAGKNSHTLYSATDGIGSAASFNLMRGMTTDGTNIYVADTSNYAIRKIIISTGEVSTIKYDAALFPVGIVYSSGNLYFSSKNRIYKIQLSDNSMTVITGQATAGFNDGAKDVALFKDIDGLAINGNTLYVADSGNFAIRTVDISTGSVTTLAGTGETAGEVDATGTDALFRKPNGLILDGTTLYLTDGDTSYLGSLGNYTIRTCDTLTGKVETIAGSSHGVADGTGTTAKFWGPQGIVKVGSCLYVVDWMNSKIRKIQL